MYAGYIRVSKVGKRKDKPERFHSPDEQRQAIERKARELGVQVEILEPDLNKKGHHERETLMRAVEGVEVGRYQGIIVPYLSRLSRRVRDTLEMWDRVKVVGRVLVVEGDLDSSKETPELRLQLTILAALAEHEHLKATERFAGQREGALEARIWANGCIPPGWIKNPDTRRLEHNMDPASKTNAAAVRATFRNCAARRTITDMAADLGISAGGVKYMLRNRLYLGELREGDVVIKGAYPAIVTEDEFMAAQEVLGTAPRKRRGTPGSDAESGGDGEVTTIVYLLSGLVRCGECGYAMSPATNKKGANYGCRNCANAISAKRLEPYIEGVARAEWQKLEARVEQDAGRIDALRGRVRAAREELAAYLSAVSAADVGADAFAEGARQRREAVEEAEGALAQALAAAPIAAVGDLLSVYDSLPTPKKTQALAGLTEGVVVRSANRQKAIPVADRVRMIAQGAGVVIDGRKAGYNSPGFRPIDFADLDSEVVLGV